MVEVLGGLPLDDEKTARAKGRDGGSLRLVCSRCLGEGVGKEQLMGLVLNWAQVVVVLRGFGVSGERNRGVQSAARGMEVVVGTANWRVPPGENPV